MTAALSEEQKDALVGAGYVRLPEVIPRRLVDDALEAINRSLGEEGMHPDSLSYLRFKTYCPELARSPVIMDLLYKSPLWELVQSAVGRGKVTCTGSAQIALRFPRPDDPAEGDLDAAPERLAPMTPHIDGVKRMPKVDLPQPQQLTVRAGDAYIAHYMLGHGIAENVTPNVRYTVYFRFNRTDRLKTLGSPQDGDGVVNGFTAIAGVQLSDLTTPDGGNFTVWPGSHALYEDFYKTHPDEAQTGFAHPELVTDMWREWDGMREVAR